MNSRFNLSLRRSTFDSLWRMKIWTLRIQVGSNSQATISSKVSFRVCSSADQLDVASWFSWIINSSSNSIWPCILLDWACTMWVAWTRLALALTMLLSAWGRTNLRHRWAEWTVVGPYTNWTYTYYPIIIRTMATGPTINFKSQINEYKICLRRVYVALLFIIQIYFIIKRMNSCLNCRTMI